MKALCGSSADLPADAAFDSQESPYLTGRLTHRESMAEVCMHCVDLLADSIVLRVFAEMAEGVVA